MAWVAVDEFGTENIFYRKPVRKSIPPYLKGGKEYGVWCDYDSPIELPHGSIQKLIGRSLTWEDEPQELK